jgi:hypothetical protein
VKGIKEVKDDARKEASELKRQLMNNNMDSRKDASELKDMMKILMNTGSNNHNNSSLTPQTQQIVYSQQVIYGGTGTQSNVFNNGITPLMTGTGTAKEKRKHDGSSNPVEEAEIAS